MNRAFHINSLTMSYFHTGTRTIIGAKAFHCPVRDGKEWDHLAMVIRLDLSPPRSFERRSKFIESDQQIAYLAAQLNTLNLSTFVKVIGSSLTSN